jgi:hypothetical protein
MGEGATSRLWAHCGKRERFGQEEGRPPFVDNMAVLGYTGFVIFLTN